MSTLSPRQSGLITSLARASLPDEALAAVPPERILSNIKLYLSQNRSPLTHKLRHFLELLADLPIRINRRFLEEELSRDGPLRPLLISALQIVFVGLYGDEGSHTLIGFTPFDRLHPERLSPPPPVRARLPVRKAEPTIDADVCVIGSGAGGAVVAHGLAARGRSVLVLERGPYHPPDTFTNREIEMLGRLYHESGLQFSMDFEMHIIQGSCVGGSTTVNNGICLRLNGVPEGEAILDEWEARGARVARDELFRSYDEVAAVIQPALVPASRMNPGAKLLEAGYRAWEAATGTHLLADRFLVNFKDCLGSGYCNIGCKYDRKLSMLASYLPLAAGTGRMEILPDCQAWQIRLSGDKASEVLCRRAGGPKPKTLRIRAKTIIVSCGAIGSSLLLRRSGIENPNIGKAISFNAGSLIHAEFNPSDYPDGVNSFDGIQMCNFIRAKNAEFYIESIYNPPMAHALSVPGWLDDHFGNMRAYRYFATAGVIVRTQPTGRLVPNLLLGDYSTAFDLDGGDGKDWKNLIAGMKLASELWLSAGAKRVLPATSRLIELRSVADLEKLDHLTPKDLFHGSSHPQGGNAMSDDTERGVVDGSFRVKDSVRGTIKNLHVCDASVFPTSIGINPQWTVMAVADYAVRTGRIQ
jgi:choline dehydrogenase-like flavoprotein